MLFRSAPASISCIMLEPSSAGEGHALHWYRICSIPIAAGEVHLVELFQRVKTPSEVDKALQSAILVRQRRASRGQHENFSNVVGARWCKALMRAAEPGQVPAALKKARTCGIPVSRTSLLQLMSHFCSHPGGLELNLRCHYCTVWSEQPVAVVSWPTRWPFHLECSM